MRACREGEIIIIDHNDLPHYKSGGSVVRNSYFWALKSIACYTKRNQNWEFDQDVWIALARMLLAFSKSGYLGHQETSLEFPVNTSIPEVFRSVATWQ